MFEWFNPSLEKVLLRTGEISSKRRELVRALNSKYYRDTLLDSNIDDLFKLIQKYVAEFQFNFRDCCLVIQALNEKIYHESLLKYFIYSANIFTRYPNLFYSLPESIDDDFPITNLFHDKMMLKIASDANIKTFNHYLRLSTEAKRLLILKDAKTALPILFKYSHMVAKKDFIAETLRPFSNSKHVADILDRINLKKKYLDILKGRGYISESDKCTLDELGLKSHVTRERIRQIEKHSIKKIINYFQHDSLDKIIFDFCFNEIVLDDFTYVFIDDFYKLINDDNYATILLLGCYAPKSEYKISSRYGIIYDATLIDIDTLISNIMDDLSPLVNLKRRKVNKLESAVLKHFYTTKDGTSYIRKGFTAIDILNILVDRYFPDGYHINQLNVNQDFIELMEHLKEDFGNTKTQWSPRNVSALFERNDSCISIDKGIYQLKKKCAVISSELLEEILEYIKSQGQIVYYISIFTHFEAELKKLGINNYFYLKGLIDSYLPDDFHNHRNYIRVGEKKITAVDDVISFMRRFDGIFSLKDLQDEYKGVKTYTFMQYAYAERKKGLLFLPSYHFLYLDKLRIPSQIIDEYYHYLLSLFERYNVELLTSNKVYKVLKSEKPALLEAFKIAKDGYVRFSMTEQFFTDKLYFRRPYICLNDNAHGDHLLDFIYSKESFDRDDLCNYSEKTGVKIINYLQLVNKCYDDYVQVDKFKFVRKDVFSIDDEQLEQIKRFLLKATEKKAIYVSSLKNFDNLPKLKYKYNPFLLAGIARTLLPDEFQVSNTLGEYLNTDYMIDRR